jgi:hypothetical protein
MDTASTLPAVRPRFVPLRQAVYSHRWRLYTRIAVSVRRTYLLSLAILVTLFVSLYPYLGEMEMCLSDECPYATQSSAQSSSTSTALAGLCLGAVLAVSSAVVFAFASLRGRRLLDERSRPAQFYLAPDPPPPQLSSGL